MRRSCESCMQREQEKLRNSPSVSEKKKRGSGIHQVRRRHLAMEAIGLGAVNWDLRVAVEFDLADAVVDLGVVDLADLAVDLDLAVAVDRGAVDLVAPDIAGVLWRSWWRGGEGEGGASGTSSASMGV